VRLIYTVGMRRLFSLLLLAAMAWMAWALLLPVAPSSPQVLIFPTGSGSAAIAASLEEHGVIRSRWAFQLVHHFYSRRRIKAGEYSFQSPANTLQVFHRMVRGDVLLHTVVVPEGYNLYEIAAAIESAGLGSSEDFVKSASHDVVLIHAIDPGAKTLEGYLFPDTYQFTRGMSMHEICAIMVRRFQREANLMGLHADVHRVVTLASIVEKETAAPDERALIAGVYTNRLRKNMALAADPTVVYAALMSGTYRGTIYQSDLQSDSPYNTYRVTGLPPGPIANPGAASLKAAMHPAETDALFFVAAGDGSGRHRFSATFDQHERNVVAYRRSKAR